jgi:hypothetical protein
VDSVQLAHETRVQLTPSNLTIQSAKTGSGFYWSLMGQGSHNSLSRVLTHGSLIPAPELFWVRTCSLDKTGVRWPLLPPRRRTPGARWIASGCPRWRHAVRCWIIADGGQASSRATLMCLGRLAHTAKVTLLDLCGRRAARREAASAGHRPSCGHTLGCAGHIHASTHTALSTLSQHNRLMSRGASRRGAVAHGPLHKVSRHDGLLTGKHPRTATSSTRA